MYIKKLIEDYPVYKDQMQIIKKACSILEDTFIKGNKLLLCGNGGSASDCEHISGELLKSFIKKRPLDKKYQQKFIASNEKELLNYLEIGFPAIPLPSLNSFLTAYSNDKNYLFAFAQLVNALGKNNDVLLAISTSGESKNILFAIKTAKILGLKTIGLTGKQNNSMCRQCDLSISTPNIANTHTIQEFHQPLYHALCAQIEHDLI